ncbi:DUF559 domain-containing protein [Candidatus Sumerlaeota bacterium]|nr:DUF559 domain-containing protein [Candidatus Sumerlaeota bacterium]
MGCQETWDQARDRRSARLLKQQGWKVMRIWEHELKHEGRTAGRIVRALSVNGAKRK